MIVKIFRPLVKGFPAVRYNSGKVERNAGELMKVANFGALQGMGVLKPADYRRYFEGLAALNKGISCPQFHATISATGRSADKYQLTELAVKWMEAMGYGSQPYLVVFHKDTLNNHVHLVSCRVDRHGKKINSGFEGKRGLAALNRLMGLDEGLSAQKELKAAFGYRFSTAAQFALIMESKGYLVKNNWLIKYGKKLLEIPAAELEKHLRNYQPDKRRPRQLKAIFEKYRQQYSAGLVPQTTPLPGQLHKLNGKFSSDLAEMLKAKFGIELVFHSSEGRQPYGYTIIDHSEKCAFKGSEVMPLKTLLEPAPSATQKFTAANPGPAIIADPDEPTRDYYRALLGATENYVTAEEGFKALGLEANGQYITDTSAGISIPGAAFDRPIRVSIAGDIDDEQINGRNRRRKKKARTNTR